MKSKIVVVYRDTFGNRPENIIFKSMTSALNFIDADIENVMISLLSAGYEPEIIYGIGYAAEVYIPDTMLCAWWDFE